MKNIESHIHPAALAASLSIAKPGIKGKSRGLPRAVYALLASQEQYETDVRIKVIDDFVRITRRNSINKRDSGVREFIVQALYDAIVNRAEQAKHATKDDTHILS